MVRTVAEDGVSMATCEGEETSSEVDEVSVRIKDATKDGAIHLWPRHGHDAVSLDNIEPRGWVVWLAPMDEAGVVHPSEELTLKLRRHLRHIMRLDENRDDIHC